MAAATLAAEPSGPLTSDLGAMYTYIVHRTQIYLSEDETEALDRLAKRTGRTRSQLIREAISAHYLAGAGADDRVAFSRALLASAGAWKGRRPTGKAFVERLRGRGLGELYDEPR